MDTVIYRVDVVGPQAGSPPAPRFLTVAAGAATYERGGLAEQLTRRIEYEERKRGNEAKVFVTLHPDGTGELAATADRILDEDEDGEDGWTTETDHNHLHWCHWP